MTFSGQFEGYLQEFRQRLKQLVVARGAAAIAIAALGITLIAVFLAIRSGFPADLMITARLVLVASIAALAYHFGFTLRRRIDAGAAADIEQRTSAFGGRVEAFLDTTDAANPMRELLAEETLKIAADHPPQRQVAAKEFGTAWSAAGLAIMILVLLATIGPGNYSYGVRDLWVGWAFPGLLPPQSIEVSPGDDGIRMGGSIRVQASMQGFEPGEAFVHASFGDGEWQQVPMSRTDGSFEFTFFSVRQPLEYFVSAANVRSPGYEVHVVDLPNVENLTLTYNYPDWTDRDPEVHDPGGDIRTIAETEVEVRITTDRPMTPGELVLADDAISMDVDGTTATATFEVNADSQYYVAAKVGGERIRLTDDYFITLMDDEAPEIAFNRPGRDWSASRIEEVTTRIKAEDDFRISSLELRYSVNGGDWQSVDLDSNTDIVEIDHVFFLEENPLVPGDLISYYAVAEDRENSSRTDMYFIDVQPFDRRYSQSQQAGGAPGQQGDQQDEVSQRQREIIISTWNLIREQNENRRGDDAYVNDNAALLSRVQETLKGQVETLAQRAEARQLTSSDAEIAEFVEHLYAASTAMTPAAERLGEVALEDALLPEQEALQHLLAAEAVFTDINISMQANNRGGSGGQAGRDLSEMFELEMDLEKNQYESGNDATPDPPQQQMEEAIDELAELARRQEQLARNQNRSQTPTPEQRWQQEMLRREVEELQRRLEQSSGQQSEDLQRRLSSALRAMNDADEGMRGDTDPESLQRAMEEAQRQLEGAENSASEAQRQAMQATVNDLANRSDELHETQAELEQRLQDAVRQFLEDRDNENRFGSGLTYDEEAEIAAEKRELLAEIQQLQRDAQRSAQNIEEDQPRVAEEIREAVAKLQELEIEARIAVAAAYIEQGEAVYIASSESAVTEALRTLREDMRRAEGMVRTGGEGQPLPGDRLQDALADTRGLRRGLQQVAGGGRDDRPESSGVRVDDLELVEALEQQAQDVSQDISTLLRDLSNNGVEPEDIDELRRLAADIRESGFSGNPEILAREAQLALSLVEQLELALAKAGRRDDTAVRSNVDEEIPEQHREIVADYYRKLGQTDEPD